MANDLTHLGILAAPTAQGRRAVAVALVGAVEEHHLVDAGFLAGSERVDAWLWSVGINPQELSSSLPADAVVHGILIPAIGSKTLVVTHEDMDAPLVDMLVSELGRIGNPAIVSGLAPTGPLAQAVNGAAGRRAMALQAAYEAALEQARRVPIEHVLDGAVSSDGNLARVSVKGPFAHSTWSLSDPEDALFVMLSLAGLSSMARFVVKDGPGAAALSEVAAEVGLMPRLAA